MHEAVAAYFTGSQCGFKCHICRLRRYPDYKHTLCPLCLAINSRWPPPPKDPPKPEKDPSLIYPGDVDPDFKPCRGDILIVDPTIGPSLRKLGFKGSCIVTYDGSPQVEFVRGDVLVRIGGYEVKIAESTPKIEEKKAKSKKPPAKIPAAKKNEKVDNKLGAKGDAKGTSKPVIIELEKPPEPEKPLDLVTYKPYEKVEVYYYNGDEWRFMGSQENLEIKQKVLLETQCPGLTAFYRYYKAGTKVHLHTLAPFLGEIVLPEWLWQEDFDHKANKWRAAGQWYRPDIPDRAKLRPGMILLRPLVGQLKTEGSTLLNTVEMDRAKKLEEAKAKELADQQLLENFLAMEKANAAAAALLDEASDPTNNKKKPSKKEAKDSKKKPKDEKDAKEGDDNKNKEKEASKKEDEKDVKKKGQIKKGAKDEKDVKKQEEAIPQVPLTPNNNEFLKLAKWGAVEMYRFEGEAEAQGWTYYGRSNRICDTAYPLLSETEKPKFVHEDDRARIVQPPPEEEKPPEPDEKNKKGNKGKKGEQEEKDKKWDTKKGDKKEETGGDKKRPKK